MIKFKLAFKKLRGIIKMQEMRILPGQVAFFLVLSIVPMITLFGYILTRFSISLTAITNFMGEAFPKNISEMLIPMVSGKGISVNVIFFMILGFILASNGPHSIIVASNMLYGITKTDNLRRRIKAFFLTNILVSLFLFITLVVAFGNMILKWILDFEIFRAYSSDIYNLFVLAKWPVALIFIFFTIKLIYTIAPDDKIGSRYVNNGALFTTIGWAIVTYIYSYYISNIANYGLFYGGLSNLVILMVWVYILSYILVLGIAVNASGYKIEEPVSEIIKEKALNEIIETKGV